MTIIVEPGLWLIGIFLLAGVAFVFGIVAVQARSERNDLTSQKKSGLDFRSPQLPRIDFALYRIVPTASYTRAEFLLEDQQRNRLGSYLIAVTCAG